LDTYQNIKKKLSIDLQLSGFDIMIHFNDHGIEKDKAYISCFKNDFKLYCSLLCNCTSKKAIRAYSIV